MNAKTVKLIKRYASITGCEVDYCKKTWLMLKDSERSNFRKDMKRYVNLEKSA